MPEVKRTGCHGFCSRGPLLTLQPEGLFYQRVKPEDAEEIVKQTVIGGELVKRLLYKPQGAKEPIAKVGDIPFFAKQTKLVLKRVGRIDPFDINDALVHGAYKALNKVLTEMTPEPGHRGGQELQAEGPGRRRFPHRASSGNPAPVSPDGTTSSATATRATPAPSWTPPSWKATPTPSWRAWPSPPTPWAPTGVSSTCAWSTRWRSRP